MKRIVVLDGSLNGIGGNTHGVIQETVHALGHLVEVDYIELKDVKDMLSLHTRIKDAQGFIVGSGTYWQSWGSPMQRFLEAATEWEGTDVFLGKPICTVITMHSVGGVEVMSRLQSIFNLLGCFAPPHCSMVHSYVNQLAAQIDKEDMEIWDLRFVPTVAHNFKVALFGGGSFMSWDADQGDIVTGTWFKKPS
jgi:NAD(P)H-dependent FMN reductase